MSAAGRAAPAASVAVDTNVLAYVELPHASAADAEKGRVAAALLDGTDPALLALPVQVLAELAHVVARKARLGREAGREAAARWRDCGALVVPTTEAVLTDALDLAAEHGLQVWDAVVLAASAEAGCAFLLTEDMHPGFAHRGCEVADPFAPPLPPRLARLLS